MKAAERKFEQGFTKWLREKFNKQLAFWVSKNDDEKSGKPNLDEWKVDKDGAINQTYNDDLHVLVFWKKKGRPKEGKK